MNHLRRIIAGVAALLFASAALAATWAPYEFNGPELYEFEVRTPGEPTTGYTIDIRTSDQTDAYGEALYEVLYTTRSYVTAADASGALMGTSGMSAMAGAFGAMYMMFLVPTLGDMDMEVGERISMMGMGRITITGMEEHGGRTGYALMLETKNSDDEYEPSVSWVVDLDLPLPLATRNYEQGQITSETTLVRYEKR